MFKNVYPREKYFKKIRPFYDSDIIKVTLIDETEAQQSLCTSLSE